MEILSVKYLGYCRARCKRGQDGEGDERDGLYHHVPRVVYAVDKCKH